MNLKKKSNKYRPRLRALRSSLRFSPFAWAKLLYLRDRGETEIGGFGLSAEYDPLLVVDVLPVKQRCSPITVAFNDVAVADLFDTLVDQGIHPQRFGRIWIHTHPGNSPLPSSVDEATFRRVFGRTDWSVMAIVARNDATYARLSFHVGPGGALGIPVRVDYGLPFDGADWAAWDQEYLDNVDIETRQTARNDNDVLADSFFDQQPQPFWDWEEFYDGASGA
jgi:proteasome lid subunit RPN8/RPN11